MGYESCPRSRSETLPINPGFIQSVEKPTPPGAFDPPPDDVGKVIWKGKPYDSVRAAARSSGDTLSTIRKALAAGDHGESNDQAGADDEMP